MYHYYVEIGVFECDVEILLMRIELIYNYVFMFGKIDIIINNLHHKRPKPNKNVINS